MAGRRSGSTTWSSRTGCRSTIWKWRNENPDFARTLEEQRAADLAMARGVLGTTVGLALEALVSILEDETAPPRVRLQAVEVVLDRAGVVPKNEAVAPGVLTAEGENQIVEMLCDDPRMVEKLRARLKLCPS